MFDHISIGVKDLDRARCFYDAALAALGYKLLAQESDALGYGDDVPAFWVSRAARPVPADKASGLHICFADPSNGRRVPQAAMASGGEDNGGVGSRQAGPGALHRPESSKVGKSETRQDKELSPAVQLSV